MNKELERILKLLHGEYAFSPTVPDYHKHWWFENALRYLKGYLRFYAKFEPEIVEFFELIS